MSHVIVIIQKVATPSAPGETESDATSYTYTMPVSHNFTPQQVGEMVKKAYRRLETPDE